MGMHYTGVTDPVIYVDSCTETVTEGGKLILRLTCCAFTRKVGEDKSVMFYGKRTRKFEIPSLLHGIQQVWVCKFPINSSNSRP